jgi:hypothetical protein
LPPPPPPPAPPNPPRVPQVNIDPAAIETAVRHAEETLQRTMPTLLLQQQEIEGDLLRQAEELQREAEKLVR